MFLNAFHLWGDAICSTVFLLFLIFVPCMFFLRVWRREPRLVARISVCVRVVGIGFIHLLIFEHIQNHSNVCAKVNSDIVSDALGIAFCTPLAQLPVPKKGRQGSALFRQGLGRMSVPTAECFFAQTARTVRYIYI